MSTKKLVTRLGLLVVLLCVSLLGRPCQVSARNATSYTYTVSTDNEWELTQDAYKPAGVLLREEQLNNPEDLYYYNDQLFIADSGNGRVLCYQLCTKECTEIAPGMFK